MKKVPLALFVLVVTSPAVVFAATTASSAVQTTVDLTALLTAIVTGILGVIGTVLSIVVPIVVNKYVQDKKAAEILEKALRNSLGKLQQAGVDLASDAIRNYRPGLPIPAALQPGLQYIADHAAEEANRLGISQESIADKIVSRIGLENIATNKAATASPSTVSVGDVQAPVVVPPFAPVPAVVTAIVPPVAEPAATSSRT